MNLFSKRLLAMLLALVLLTAGLIQGGAVEADATETMSFTIATDCHRNPAFPKKGNTVNLYNFGNPLKGNATSSSPARYSEKEGNWTLTYLGPYSQIADKSGYLSSVVANVANLYSIKADDVIIHQLTRDGVNVVKGVVIAESATEALFIGGNYNSQGGGYLLMNRTPNAGFSITITDDAATNAGYSGSAHTHVWNVDVTGNGTHEAKATITCIEPGCPLTGATVVSLTAFDVTLPGDVFTAQISSSVQPELNTLTISQTPGYKYSTDGTNYTAITPSNFEAAEGFYQASILIMDGNAQVANLFVNYVATNPIVTAATGDNRPIEMMFVGMVTFAAMAAAAFILDSKRRANF